MDEKHGLAIYIFGGNAFIRVIHPISGSNSETTKARGDKEAAV